MKKYSFKPGMAYIRIAPNGDAPWEDYSYSNEPLIFKSMKNNGDLVFTYSPATRLGRLIKDKELVLDEEWNDDKWIPYNSLKRMKKTSLHELQGKYIVRKCPVGQNISFMDESVKLIAATKYHLVIFDPFINEEIILDSRFTNPNDWVEVD